MRYIDQSDSISNGIFKFECLPIGWTMFTNDWQRNSQSPSYNWTLIFIGRCLNALWIQNNRVVFKFFKSDPNRSQRAIVFYRWCRLPLLSCYKSDVWSFDGYGLLALILFYFIFVKKGLFTIFFLFCFVSFFFSFSLLNIFLKLIRANPSIDEHHLNNSEHNSSSR